MTATLEKDLTPPPPPADETPAEPGRSRGPLVKALLLMAVVGAALAALIVVVVNQSDDPTIDPFEVTVSADSATKLASGDLDDLVPATIRVEPGQQIVLRNNDWQPHTLGDLTAERGDTVRMSFPTEGRHITATTLRADGRLTILVEAPSS
jgi:plastocyanin